MSDKFEDFSDSVEEEVDYEDYEDEELEDDKESLKYKLKCIESIQNNRKQDN